MIYHGSPEWWAVTEAGMLNVTRHEQGLDEWTGYKRERYSMLPRVMHTLQRQDKAEGQWVATPAGGWCWKEKVWVKGEKSDWESPGLKRKAETDRKEETVMVVGG